MIERPRLSHWPDNRVIEVVEESIQKIEAARDAMQARVDVTGGEPNGHA